MMKQRKSAILLTSILAVFALVFSQIGDLRAAPPVTTDFVCFPTCAAVDSRMLAINSSAGAMSGTIVNVGVNVAADAPNFLYGIFDADSTNLWDQPTSAVLRYELFADPLGNGTGTFLVDSFTADAAFLALNLGNIDNKWFDRTINTVAFSANPATSAQVSDTDIHHYRLRISTTTLNTAGGTPAGTSGFKVRTSGALGLQPQNFAYIAQMRAGNATEVGIVYPLSGGSQFGNLSQTTYDGTWDFSFFVPVGALRIDLFDGDMDYGNKNCTLAQDTDDPDTPTNYVDPSTGNYITPWTGNTYPAGAANEGVPTAIQPSGTLQNCDAGTIPVGNPAQTTGNPADDATAASILKRSPSFGQNVVYRLIGPDGITSWDNLNPSGQIEWEQFTIDGDPLTPYDRNKMDYEVTSLASGVYRTHVEGVDIGNLNAWYFANSVMVGVTPSGAPVPPDAFYLLQGTVFHDNSGNGVQDGAEQGVGGVAIVSIYASTGDFVATATTLADGSYSFRVAGGNYFVVVEGVNFNSGKVLNGYYSTTGGNSQAAFAPSGGDTQDFGYRLAPVAVDDAYTAHKNTSLTIVAPGIVVNDTNVDNPSGTLSASAVTQPSHGTVTVNANGGFTYTPDFNYVGTDSFTYKVNDGAADSNVATVTITINNDPPVARDDAYSTNENVTLTVAAPGILVNDSDPNGDPLTVTLGTTTTNGTLTLNADGSFQYVPNTDFVGTDTFTYTVSDGLLNSMSATVTITVVGHPPVAVNDSETTLPDTPVVITVLSNDSDPDHNPISITSTTPPSNGTIVVNGDGTITYTPNAGFVGVDTFTYTISDTHGGTSTATVTVTIVKLQPTATATGGTYVYDGSSRPGTCVISDGLVGTLTYTPGGTTAPTAVGTYTVNCDYPGDLTHYPAHATATITITPAAENTHRMTGGGNFGKQDVKHGFELHCDARVNPNRLEVNWGNGNRFHLEELTSAVCSLDPSLNARQPTNLFNTYVGVGKGRLNGVSGATATWTFTDGGEPGTKDSATLVIKNAAGHVILSASGSISKGNQQAHR